MEIEFLYDIGQGWIYAASLVLLIGAGEIALVATGFTGYGAGLAGDGERGSKLPMAVLIATVLIW